LNFDPPSKHYSWIPSSNRRTKTTPHHHHTTTTTTTKMQVRSAYRQLWRAATTTFSGDAYALENARVEIRNQIEVHRHAQPKEVPTLLEALHDAHDFLSNNITQARQTEENTFRVELEDPHKTGRGIDAVGSDGNLDFSVVQSDDPLPTEVPKNGVVVESSKK
jgi:hypothetical protein